MAPTATSPLKATNGVKRKVPSRLYSLDTAPSLEDFKQLKNQSTGTSTYPLAKSIVSNVPVYDLSKYSSSDSSITFDLQDEWNHILLSGPGVFVLKAFQPDTALIGKVNSIFDSIIQSEACTSKGDHFAASGNNSRIWNSFQKHAELDPASFIQYYSNPWLNLVCESWLGPAYQLTAQVNIVKPGGKPQVSHRDYHLGFQTAEACAKFPKVMQIASQLLTLQGGVAHSQMTLDSGPTRFLPFSQLFEDGYMAYRRPEFVEYFEKNWVSTALEKGDAVFFSPALFHAAGENCTSNVERSANLLQVSSAFGRTMESIDTLTIIARCWEQVVKMYEHEGMSAEVECAVKAIASGYPFPTNLDRRPPAPGGMAPESEADVLMKSLRAGSSKTEVVEAVRKLRQDSLP